MSRYKAYSEYKDSGVEWLGKTPVDWKVIRLGIFFSERREKVSDKEYIPLSVTKKGIVLQLDSAAKTDNGDNRKKVLIGDFVINSRSDRKGSSGVSSFEGSVSLINIVLMPNNINQKFIHHLFRSERFQEEFYRNGKGIVADLWTTNYSEMKNIYLAVPSSIEQQKIADFLDYETSKIDQLINKQKVLIELLKEKRQALISQAVTKGLNPNVKMKDTGIDWLGEIPEHWLVTQIKYGYSVTLGKMLQTEPKTEKDELKPYIRAANIQNHGVDVSDIKQMWFSEEERKNLLLECGDLLVSEGGDVGRCAIWDNPLEECYIQNAINRIRGIKNNLTMFLYYWINMLKTADYINIICNKATIAHYTAEKVAATPVLLPPISEQNAIIEFLNEKKLATDGLIEKTSKAILLLQERRTALISAAVTGKIDVRDWQPPNAIDTMTNITPN